MHKNRHINHIDINQLHRLGKVNTNRWQYVARYVIPISWWAHTEADRNKTIVKLALMKVIRIGIAQLSPLSPLTVANNKTIKPQQQHIPPNWLPPFDGYLSDHAWNSTPPLLSLSSGRVGVSKKDNTIWWNESTAAAAAQASYILTRFSSSSSALSSTTTSSWTWLVEGRPTTVDTSSHHKER